MTNKKANLFIFDYQDNLLSITNNYIEAPFEEDIEFPISLSITMPIEDESSQFLIGGNQVAFYDLKGDFRLFVIREVDEEDGDTGEKTVTCLPSITQDLDDVFISDRRPSEKTAEEVLQIIIEESRWEVGNVVDLGTNSTNFYEISALEALRELKDIWGGEIVDRIEIEGNKIAHRYIDIVYSKGVNRGKRFEMGKDIEMISVTELFYPKTALIGKGSAVESGEGYSNKINFENIEWTTENGDPANKPIGQNWIGDEEARLRYGIYNSKTDEIDHRFGFVEFNDEEDEERLLELTYNHLQETKEPQFEYTMEISTFYGLSDYEHEQVFVGDTGIARNKNMNPILIVQARISSLTYDLADASSGEVTIGNIIDLTESDNDIQWAIEKVKNNSARWETGEVSDESFPDEIPPTPTNVQAKNGFAKISLTWDYEPSSYIASYEVYASNTSGFSPSDEYLVWQGKAGGFVHDLEVNRQMYYRIRAVNTHGTPSEFTEEVSGRTLQINAETDVEEQTITEKLLAGEAIIDTLHLHEGSVTNGKIKNLRWDKAVGGTAQLGGSGNGNGILEILDSSDNMIVILNQDGITLDNGAQLIGNGGVLSNFVTQMASYERVGVDHVGPVHQTNLSLTVPENFNITRAHLYIYALPFRYEDYGKASWTNVSKLNVELSEGIEGFYDYVESSSSGEGLVFAGQTVSMNELFGMSSWTPPRPSSTNYHAERIDADILDYIESGNIYNITMKTKDVNAAPQNNNGMIRAVVEITGYQQ